MIKKIFILANLLWILGVNAVFAESVVDTQNLLTPEEITSLTQKIQRVEQQYQVKIGIEFLKNTHGQTLEATANSLLDKNFSGAPNGGILLLVVMDTRKWQISTDYEMRQRISDTNALSGAFLSKLSSGDYYGACSAYIDGVEENLYYQANPQTGFNPMALMISIVIAIVCGVMFRSMLIGSMSNVHPAKTAAEYLQRNTVKITERRDTYLFTNTSRRRKSKGGTSSSGRSGGGSGGGGSHGGSGGSF